MLMVPTLLHAPEHWARVDCLSDVHLCGAMPRTFAAWQTRILACEADALFILGDLFEAWVGDDILDSECAAAAGCDNRFEQNCAALLRQSAALRPTYVMHGNRDFLLGPAFYEKTACLPLPDPSVLVLGVKRWLLSHGDALCLADADYQAMRSRTRQAAWQAHILAQPLQDRLALAHTLRQESEMRQLPEGQSAYVDIDFAAAQALLRQTEAQTLVHGHTHRPGRQTWQGGLERIVLSDWDWDAEAPISVESAESTKIAQGSAATDAVADDSRCGRYSILSLYADGRAEHRSGQDC